MIMQRVTTLLFLFALSGPAWAADREFTHLLIGRVVSVTDGNNITVLDGSKNQHRVRLLGVNAPAIRQPYGSSARKYLSSLVLRKLIRVEWNNTDSTGRILGKVWREKVDVNYQMVLNGLAQHAKTPVGEQPAGDQQAYAEAEASAKQNQERIWKNWNPAPK